VQRAYEAAKRAQQEMEAQRRAAQVEAARVAAEKAAEEGRRKQLEEEAAAEVAAALAEQQRQAAEARALARARFYAQAEALEDQRRAEEEAESLRKANAQAAFQDRIARYFSNFSTPSFWSLLHSLWCPWWIMEYFCSRMCLCSRMIVVPLLLSVHVIAAKKRNCLNSTTTFSGPGTPNQALRLRLLRRRLEACPHARLRQRLQTLTQLYYSNQEELRRTLKPIPLQAQ